MNLSIQSNEIHSSGVTESDGIPKGRHSLRRRMIVAVNFLFLVTMAVFVTASFFSERSLHYRQTFDHLDETLCALSSALSIEEMPSPESLARLERRLEEKTEVAHRIFFVGPDKKVATCSRPALIGGSFEGIFEMETYGPSTSDWVVAKVNPYPGAAESRQSRSHLVYRKGLC